MAEVKHWLIYADDERKFNVPVTYALVRESLTLFRRTQHAFMISDTAPNRNFFDHTPSPERPISWSVPPPAAPA